MLELLHEYLHLHFSELRDQRQEGVPVFALEHGLNSEERKQLKVAVQDSVPGKFWLPWVVHATEVGYNFSGHEYWGTFQEETSGWWKHGNRKWLKKQFKRFHDEYGGIEPSGAWAAHYSFISWPITHAILAGDLRNHLIEILHSVRDSLESRDWLDASHLGRQIRIQAQSRSHVSSRFVQFAKQERLIGHIAKALLQSEDEMGRTLIEKSALERIVNGLEEEKRVQLEEASRSAQEGRAANRRANSVEDAIRALQATLAVRPAGENAYRVSLEIPSLKSLLELGDEFETALTERNVQIEGAQQHRFPPRALTLGPTEVRLSRWTLMNTGLLKFECASDEDAFEAVAGALNEHLFDVGHGPWLFKLRKDGKGKNIRSRSVRPGSAYVIVGRRSKLADVDIGTQLDIRADGVAGRYVDLGNPLNEREEAGLRQLGFKIKGEVDVWPVGVVPASYDGQDEATWLTSDTPMLGIHSNLSVTQYEIDLSNGEASSTVAAPEEGPVFVKVPGLSIGAHTLTVSAQTSGGRQEEQLRVKVRRPEEDRGDNAKIWPLHVTVSSVSASLEELWENEIGLTARGPRGREVAVSLKLHAQDSVDPLAEERDVMSLPVTRDDWKEFIQNRCRHNPGLVEHFDEAYKAEVSVDGGIIGSKTIPFERRHTLLRWKRVDRDGEQKVQLLDDTGENLTTEIHSYSPATPLETSDHQAHGPDEAFETLPFGQLWQAEASPSTAAREFTATRIVPPTDQQEEEARIELGRNVDEITRAVRIASLWSQASVRDAKSATLQRTVLASIQTAIVRAICGVEWTDQEKQWLDDPTTEGRESLAAMVDKTSGRPNPVEEALTNLDMPPGPDELAGWIRDNRWLRQRRRIENIGSGARVENLDGLSRKGLARLALQILRDVSGAAEWDALEEGVKQLIDNPDLARTTRAVILAQQTEEAKASPEPESAEV